MRGKRRALWGLVTGLMLLVAACAPAATPAPTQPPPPTQAPAPTEAPAPTAAPPAVGSTYVIGFAAAGTGPVSSLGEPEVKTAEMIKAQLEAQGGVTGPDGVVHPVDVVIYDTESNPDTAVSVVRRLIDEDKVVAVVAGTSSGNSIAIAPVTTEAEVPYVSMASALKIVQLPDSGDTNPWAFKTPQDNTQSAVWQARYLKAKGISKVCHLYMAGGYGTDTFNQATAVFGTEGIEIVYSDPFDPAATEFGAQMAKVQTSGCEAVVVGAIPPAASNMTVALHDFVPDLPIIQGHGTCNLDFIRQAGAAAEGVVTPCGRVMVADTLPADDPQLPVLKQYIEDYTTFTNGSDINTFGGHAWDGLMFVVDALSSLDDGLSLADQRSAVRDYIEGQITDWPGISGVFNMTATDHFGLSVDSLTFVKVENGAWVYFPQDQW